MPPVQFCIALDHLLSGPIGPGWRTYVDIIVHVLQRHVIGGIVFVPSGRSKRLPRGEIARSQKSVDSFSERPRIPHIPIMDLKRGIGILPILDTIDPFLTWVFGFANHSISAGGDATIPLYLVKTVRLAI